MLRPKAPPASAISSPVRHCPARCQRWLLPVVSCRCAATPPALSWVLASALSLYTETNPAVLFFNWSSVVAEPKAIQAIVVGLREVIVDADHAALSMRRWSV
ncbi:unnamed protein product [Camellia sinensis]